MQLAAGLKVAAAAVQVALRLSGQRREGMGLRQKQQVQPQHMNDGGSVTCGRHSLHASVTHGLRHHLLHIEMVTTTV